MRKLIILLNIIIINEVSAGFWTDFFDSHPSDEDIDQNLKSESESEPKPNASEVIESVFKSYKDKDNATKDNYGLTIGKIATNLKPEDLKFLHEVSKQKYYENYAQFENDLQTNIKKRYHKIFDPIKSAQNAIKADVIHIKDGYNETVHDFRDKVSNKTKAFVDKVKNWFDLKHDSNQTNIIGNNTDQQNIAKGSKNDKLLRAPNVDPSNAAINATVQMENSMKANIKNMSDKVNRSTQSIFARFKNFFSKKPQA